MAGYRVLRSAGHGDRTRLLVGFDDGHTVVLKVGAAEDVQRTREIEALSRAAGDHVVGLVDVAADGVSGVLVLERLPGGTLAELLERRGVLDVGEAVTILAPLAATLDRIHAAGVAHAALSLSGISFREDGAPTLTGFGEADLFSPGSPEVVRERVPGVIADRVALRDIAAAVLGRVTGEGASAARGLAARLPDATPETLGRELFDLAIPTPVRFEPEAAADIVARIGEPVAEMVADDEPSRVTVPPVIVALLPDVVRDRVLEVLAQARLIWTGWQPGQRRLILGAAAAGLTVAVAVVVVPAGPVEPTSPRVTPVPSTSQVADGALPDDPVEAAKLLLGRREQCIRELSPLCLAEVVESGSAASDDDVALIRSIQSGTEYPDGGILDGDPVLVERLGDSALLDLPPGSQPGSVLLMRTTNGWRIRDYLDAPAVSSGSG